MVWGIVLVVINFAIGTYFEKPKSWKWATRFLANVFWLPLFIVAMITLGIKKVKETSAGKVHKKQKAKLTVVK
ncbi:hypothetical protein B4086_5783 [Bacillus cereus]|nr:hypothetical protein B4086_5783 [Bacillus cereus]